MEILNRRGFHWAWIILAVSFFNVAVCYSIRLGFGTIFPVMIPYLSLTRIEGSTIINFHLAVYICLTPLMGNLTDRFGARWIIALFCIVLGTGTFLMGTVDHFWSAFFLFGLVGAGASAMWIPVLTVVQRWFAPRRRGMALGILCTGVGLGIASIGLFFPILVEFFSWRFCWYVLGVSALILALFNGTFIRNNPEDLDMSPWGKEGHEFLNNVDKRPSAYGGRYREIFHSYRFWTIGASYFFLSCAHFMITTFLVDYANAELGFSFKEASFLVTIRGLSQVVGVLTIPPLSDRIGRKLALIITNMSIALSILGIIVSAKEPLLLSASVVFLSIFLGAVWPLYGACGGDYFRKEIIGTVLGAWTPFYGLGGISAHFVGGGIWDITQSYRVAFYLATLSALVASILMLILKRPGENGKKEF